MFALLVIIVAGVGYLYYRWHGPVMFEAARSYLYLEALREGATNHDANARAALSTKDVTHVIRHHAKCHRMNLYRKPVLESKIWPQIGEAYRRGMSPPLLPSSIWHLVEDWSRKGKYQFPPVVRAKLLVRQETAYEAYYSEVLNILAVQTGLAYDHIATLVGRVDDEGFRNAFNNKIEPVEWANTLSDVYLRKDAPLASAVLQLA
jgi:hypothetical protein